MRGTINVKKRQEKHGLSGGRKNKDPLYTKWCAMKSRCYDPKHNRYNTYGGKGIQVCDEWKNSFLAFHNWAIQNGYKIGLTIERIDNLKNYEPSNCKFITMREQSKNKTTNRPVTFRGETKLITEWAKDLGSDVNHSIISARLASGWDLEKAITTPRDGTVNVRYVEYEGKKVRSSKLAKEFNIHPDTFWKRLERGWDIKTALTTKVQKRK